MFLRKSKYTVGNQLPTVLDYYLDDVHRTKEIRKNDEIVASFQYSQDGLPKAVSYPNGSSMSMQYIRSQLADYSVPILLIIIYSFLIGLTIAY